MCTIFIEEAAKRHGIGIRELAVDDDHVHAEVDVPCTMSVSDAFGKLKGFSAYMLFKTFPNFRKRYPRGHFWSGGKCGRSVGDVDQETVIDYVRRQAEQRTIADFAH